MREGAGNTGMTIAKALQSLRDNTLQLDRWTLVVVDEAGMVGTDDLRQLLTATATTAAEAKTVLVGDAHQLAQVKARGGMFAQLCTDLPWTQHLSEVWRMTDPAERTASLALRDGGPTAVRRAVDWYRTHDRLHCGDAITMAADALTAYQSDANLGRDAVLICDTTEMADALNERTHHDRVDREAATVTGPSGQRIGVGDLIVSRRNDPSIDFHHSTPNAETLPPVRNGNRWRVAGIDVKTNHVAAERLDDRARVIFEGDYLRAPEFFKVDESSGCYAAVVSVSWVMCWAGWLIQTVWGRSRIFGASVVPKRCGWRARASVRTARRLAALSVANPKCTSAGVCSPIPV
jgi:hypothetical protein